MSMPISRPGPTGADPSKPWLRRFDAAIFDLDGTLVDSEEGYALAVRAILAEHGVRLSRVQVHALVYGLSWGGVYQNVRALLPGVFKDVPSLVAAVDRWQESRGNDASVIAESRELLRRLARWMPVCIVSGAAGQRVRQTARRLGLADDLAFAWGYEDYPAGKPDPSGFRLAAEALSVRPDRCVVFEDSAAGVQAARGAGMACVALTRHGAVSQDVSQADLCVEDLMDRRVLKMLAPAGHGGPAAVEVRANAVLPPSGNVRNR